MIDFQSLRIMNSIISYNYIDSEGITHRNVERFYEGALDDCDIHFTANINGLILEFQKEDRPTFFVTMIDGDMRINAFEHYYKVSFGKTLSTRILPKLNGIALVISDSDMILVDEFVNKTKMELFRVRSYQKTLLENNVTRYHRVGGPKIHPLETRGLQFVN